MAVTSFEESEGNLHLHLFITYFFWPHLIDGFHHMSRVGRRPPGASNTTHQLSSLCSLGVLGIYSQTWVGRLSRPSNSKLLQKPCHGTCYKATWSSASAAKITYRSLFLSNASSMALGTVNSMMQTHRQDLDKRTRSGCKLVNHCLNSACTSQWVGMNLEALNWVSLLPGQRMLVAGRKSGFLRRWWLPSCSPVQQQDT